MPRPTATQVAERLIILRHVVVYALTAPPVEVLRDYNRLRPAEREKFTLAAEAQRDLFWKALRESPLWNAVSPHERRLADSTAFTMPLDLRNEAAWRVESAQVLMWALGKVPLLLPNDAQFMREPLKWTKEQPSIDEKLLAEAQLRDTAEIDRERDLADLWYQRTLLRESIESKGTLPTELVAQGFPSHEEAIRGLARRSAQLGAPRPIDGDFNVNHKAYRDLTADEWATVHSITVERHFAFNWLCGRAIGEW